MHLPLPITVDGITCARIAIMLIPSYTAAALTGEMVWTVPTLAAASVLAASVKPTERTQRVDAIACARIAIMLIPSYTVAALTGEMVWTVPTLAAASVLAASVKPTERTQRAVDDDGGDDDGGGDVDTDVDTDIDTDVDTE